MGDPITISVRAAPGARVSEVLGRYGDDGWKIRIAAVPEQGKANTELCAFLARLLGVGRGDVEVMAGGSGRDKLVRIHGVDLAKVTDVLDA